LSKLAKMGKIAIFTAALTLIAIDIVILFDLI